MFRVKSSSSSSYLFFFPLLCVGLGSWQLYRLKWKQELMASMNDRLNSSIVSQLPSNPEKISDLEHCRVLLSGKFLHEFEMLVGPRNKGGAGRPGYYIYTPLLLDNDPKTMVIVNRGWIPKAYAHADTRKDLHPQAMPDHISNLHGMLRRPENYQPRLKVSFQNIMNYYNDVPASQWLWVDLQKMSAFVKDQLKIVFETIPAEQRRSQTMPELKIIDQFFIEEVLDPESNDVVSEEMKAWEHDLEARDSANSSLPTILANLKTIGMDPRSFHGKPIIGTASVNLPNKHLEYVYTWYSLAALLTMIIIIGKRRNGRF